tara:strand:- start:233 stop:514 length:282 start_codon:yes stop_codon:yes gene_type:complete
MADKLPHDFEQKVRMAPAVGGKGYPYQLSAKHLMDNFRHVNKDQAGMPDGSEGDILRYDGYEWRTVITNVKEVSVCVDGTPETWIILTLPFGV